MNEIYIFSADVDLTTMKNHVSHLGTLRWVYFARDYRIMRKLALELGEKSAAINIADILNQVADDLRTEHVEWVDMLNRTNGGHLTWWFGAVSSRDIYSSNLFLYNCYLIALQRIWQNPETRPNIIIADSPGLAECIELWIKTNFTNAIVKKELSRKSFLRDIRPCLQYVQALAILGMRCLAALLTRIGSNTEKKKGYGGPFVVVDAFVHEDSIADNGVFRDRYFPFLHEFLQSKGHQVLVHPILYVFSNNYISMFRRMRKSYTRFIIPEDYLHFSDYAAALAAPLALRNMKKLQGCFKGINFDQVLQEIHRLQSPAPVIQAILSYRLWRRLRQSGIELSWVINWYENQVIDKALIAGVREAYPDISIIGAQIFVPPPNLLSVYPSQSEHDADFTPDIILQTGESQCQTALRYAHAIPCKAAAALRYAHLYAQGNTERILNHNDAVLVLLPFYMDEALEILDTLMEAMKEVPAGTEFLIKYHPDYDSATEIIDAFGCNRWPKEFRIWDGSLSAAFEKAAVVIAANSSAMVEAMVLGIPVIFIKRQSNLNMNPLAEISSDGFVSCENSLQVASEIARYRSLSQEERDVLIFKGLLLRDQYFTKVDDNSLKAFELSETKPCSFNVSG